MVEKGLRLRASSDPTRVPLGGIYLVHLQTRHNYEISYPYEWGERLDETHVPFARVFFLDLSQYNGTANPICP